MNTAIVAAGRKRAGFAGLANQGATCYMNSLLQTLFMTPEFRRVLFAWRYDKEKDDEPGDSIPYQLQLLFAQLQLTEARAITTTALTHSFGWTGRESFQQHDVQELARVLFDALERSLSGTANSTLVRPPFRRRLRLACIQSARLSSAAVATRRAWSATLRRLCGLTCGLPATLFYYHSPSCQLCCVCPLSAPSRPAACHLSHRPAALLVR